MSDYSMADISSLLQSVGKDNGYVAINSTSRSNNIDLDMTDFLQLMIVQLQSQTIDDTMDTSEMMNQMVQMQMITAITNMTETNIMTYASSLVGKEVTIGVINGDELEERVITVTGTAMSNGSQVIFGSDGETYSLNQIMAVGRLPEIEGITKPDDSTTDPTAPTEPTQPTDPVPPTDPDETEDDNTQIPGDATDKPIENPNSPEDGGSDIGNSGTDGTITPTEPVG